MLKCILIDDEETSRMVLERLISTTPDLSFVKSFDSAIEAIKYLNKEEGIDLIFLDIHMPSFSGFDFIETLKISTSIVLTTSDKNFALEAFEYPHVLDYLLKPITPKRFKKTIQKLQAKKELRAHSVENKDSKPINVESELYVNVDRRLIKINIPSIQLVEAKGDYILIKTSEKNYTVHASLKKIEEKLPASLFLKVHRSYIINLREIIDIEDNSLVIAKAVVPISRANRPELMRRLNLL